MSESIQRFLDPEKVLFQAGLGAGQTVADLGAGSGFYAVASGKLIGTSGQVFVVDILDTALDHTAAEARLRGIKNIRTIKADLEHDKVEAVPTGSCDLVVMANIVHQLKERLNLFQAAYRMLKTGGKLLVVDWNSNSSPIGPAAAGRVDENEVRKMAEFASLKSGGDLVPDSYHYGLMFIK